MYALNYNIVSNEFSYSLYQNQLMERKCICCYFREKMDNQGDGGNKQGGASAWVEILILLTKQMMD
jgi:hypothetical protein